MADSLRITGWEKRLSKQIHHPAQHNNRSNRSNHSPSLIIDCNIEFLYIFPQSLETPIHISEWGQVYCFLFAMVYASGLSLRPEPARWFYRLLTVGYFYVIMEEISWGQRIIGFSTPEFFKIHNLQGEVNLHNLITDPVDTRRVNIYSSDSINLTPTSSRPRETSAENNDSPEPWAKTFFTVSLSFSTIFSVPAL